MTANATEDSSHAPETPPLRFDKFTVAAYAIAFLAPWITAALFFNATRSAGVEIGFPLDDSWIHAQYARTLVEGRPLQYVEGEVSMGTTAPLFDVLWAAGTLITGEYVYTIHVINVLVTGALGVLLVAWLLRLGVPPLTAGCGAALIVTTYPFTWSNLSGMETALASALTTAAVLAHLTWGRRSGWRHAGAPVLMALAAMCRPENLILYPFSELDRLWLRWREHKDDRSSRPIPRFITRAAAYGLAIFPYVALNYAVHGAPVPNTYQAKIGKMGAGNDLQERGLGALHDRFAATQSFTTSSFEFIWNEDNAIILVFAALGIVILFLRQFLKMPDEGAVARTLYPLLIFVGGAAAVGFLTMDIFYPGQCQRYLMHRIPLILVYGVVGVHWAARGISSPIRSAARPVYAVVIVAFIAGNIAHLRGRYPWQIRNYVTSVKNINEMQVALGHWIDENTPEDAIIATNDIGAITFFANRPIVDTIGLIDPEVVRRRTQLNKTELMLEYLESRGVTHALLFPSWHPAIILDPRMRPIHRIVLTDNHICGDDRMLVMETDWDASDAGKPLPDWVSEELDHTRSLLKRQRWMPF
jgi:hypothetical protein